MQRTTANYLYLLAIKKIELKKFFTGCVCVCVCMTGGVSYFLYPLIHLNTHTPKKS